MLSSDIQKLLHKYKTDNIYKLAELTSFIVHTVSLSEKIQGIYCYIEMNKVIVINENLPEDKKKELLAELIKFGIVNRKHPLHII